MSSTVPRRITPSAAAPARSARAQPVGSLRCQPFPFSTFDPLHPDPSLLPAVGRFFTGPDDVRPTLLTLDAHLGALGQPPADAGAWRRVLAARTAALAVHDEQDQAALTADPPAFIKSVHDVERTFRAVAITATVFGVSQCVL